IVGTWHCVVLERAGQQLPARLVVDQVLHQRLAGPLDDPAVDLPLAEQWVEDSADIVDRDIAGQDDFAGLLLDLVLATMRPPAECPAARRSDTGPVPAT